MHKGEILGTLLEPEEYETDRKHNGDDARFDIYC